MFFKIMIFYFYQLVNMSINRVYTSFGWFWSPLACLFLALSIVLSNHNLREIPMPVALKWLPDFGEKVTQVEIVYTIVAKCYYQGNLVNGDMLGSTKLGTKLIK